MRCGECGSRNTARKNVKGQEFPHREHDKLKLLFDVQLECCNECDNIMMRGDDAKDLSKALDASIDPELCERCKDPMDPNLNTTPDGNYFCDDCISMDDVFGDDDG